MRRLLALILCLVLASSLGLGSVAHAMEPIGCINQVEAAESGHEANDSDQVPADAEKDYPHHHGSCHDHQIGEPARVVCIATAGLRTALIPPDSMRPIASIEPNPAQRPPKA